MNALHANLTFCRLFIASMIAFLEIEANKKRETYSQDYTGYLLQGNEK